MIEGEEKASLMGKILKIIKEDERSRADIKDLNIGLYILPICIVKLNDLEAVEVNSAGLVECIVAINKSDNSQAISKFVKECEQKFKFDLTNGEETNFYLIIQDENGKKHTETLFVN